MRIWPAILLATAATLAAQNTTTWPLRDSWTLIPGAEDLIATGSWGCVSGLTFSNGTVTLTTANNYVTPLNTAGPQLAPQGDFSVLAALSQQSGTGWLTLVGAQGKSTWYDGLLRVDTGLTATGLTVSVYMNSPDAANYTFDSGAPVASPAIIEVARIGTQFAFSLNGVELGRIDDPGLFPNTVFIGMNGAPNSVTSLSALAASAPAGSSSTVLSPAYQQVYPDPGNGLRDSPAQLLIGAAVNPSLLSNTAYASTLATQFSLIVPENVLKFDAVHPAQNQYNFCPADQLLSFAQANGMKMRGHNFVWHQQVPAWVTKGNFTSDQLLQIMHDHIFTVAGHYQGQLVSWDVVNEALTYGPPYVLRPDSIWGTTIGPSYIDSAFTWARQADPNALLFYNDTGGEGLGAKSDAIYNLVASMVNRGIPIDGVGLEMHVNVAHPIPPADLASNIQRLNNLGLMVSITEMDIESPDPLTPTELASQAQIYSDVVSTCLAAANCVAFGTWGISDAYSWIPSTYPGNSGGLLFDANFQPKPAYPVVLNLLTPPPLER